MTSSSRVLLVGGSGLLGGSAASALLADGHDVAVLTRGARPAPEGVEALVADRSDAAALARALAGRRFDCTIDFLAFDDSDVERLFASCDAAFGTYVLISSGQVYLVTEGGTPPFREEDSGRPLMREPAAGTRDHEQWRYGMGKRRAEAAVRALDARGACRAIALRLPIVQGAHDATLRLWAYLERLLDGGPLILPEGGTQPVRHLHADDLARALVRLVRRWPDREPVLNLSPDRSATLREFLDCVARSAGVIPRFVTASASEIAAAGIAPDFSPYSGRWTSILDPSRAAGALAFEARPMLEFIPEVVAAHVSRRPGRSHPGYAHRARELGLAAKAT